MESATSNSAPAAAGSLRDTIDADPYGFYDAVREAGDVVWDDGLGAWLITSDSAIRELMRRDKVMVRHSAASRNDAALHRVLGGPRSRLLLSGEIHAQHHRWFLQHFASPHVDGWRPTLLRPILARLIDDIAPRGRAELMGDVSDRYSVRVISAILGFPLDDGFVSRIKGLIDRKQGYINLALVGASAEETRLALEAADEMDALVLPYVEAARERAADPDDILASLWAEGPSIRADWNADDVLAWITTTYFAGTDTTTHAIQNAFYLLLTVPGLQEALRDGGEGEVARFSEEVLRMYPSVHFTHRLANEDFELDGAAIRAEDQLFMLDAGANRDPRRHARPNEIDLGREKSRGHLAFSAGPRMCAGSALARAEIEECVSGVLRLGNLRLDPEAEQPALRGFLLRSYAPLNVLFDPA